MTSPSNQLNDEDDLVRRARRLCCSDLRVQEESASASNSRLTSCYLDVRELESGLMSQRHKPVPWGSIGWIYIDRKLTNRKNEGEWY
jgi:hypothetical protein